MTEQRQQPTQRVLQSEQVRGASSEHVSNDVPKKFASVEDELHYLRNRVREHERVLGVAEASPARERIIARELKQYAAAPTKEVLDSKYIMPDYQSVGMSLGLQKEEHDQQVDELVRIMQSEGIKNALTVAARVGSHLEDDFHRVLVQTVAEGITAKGLAVGGEEWRALHQVLYEVSIPTERGDEKKENIELEKLLNSMEQFYSGMRAVTEHHESFLTRVLALFGLAHVHTPVYTIEIAVPQGTEQASFYVSVPREKRGYFEKHLLSIYPSARLIEQKNDHNIFTPDGADALAVGTLSRHPVYPLKHYKTFQHDPLNVILSSFGKMQKHGEGAAIQLVIGNKGEGYNTKFKKIIDELRKGGKPKHAILKATKWWGKAYMSFREGILGEDSKAHHQGSIDQLAMDQMQNKVNSRIMPVNIRIVGSAKDFGRAQEIVGMIASTFNQFDEAQGNNFVFKSLSGHAFRKELKHFIHRTMHSVYTLPLSIAELTTMVHLTATAISTSRELKQSKAKKAPAPIDMPDDGIVLGVNKYGGGEQMIRYAPKDRVRHFYVIGQTGAGKSVLLTNMIIQDIRAGNGVCFVDPHGSDIVDVLAAVPPERFDDVIYFDPANADHPMSINIMEFDPKYPEQKTFVVNEIMSIFEKLFGSVPESLGPMFQQYFRNGAMLVLEGMPAGQATMADIPRVLANAKFRKECLKNSKNPIVNQFWTEIAEKAGSDASLENVVPYITSKTDIFLANDIMRPIIAYQNSSFNFREIMDTKKIFLANLSKGRLGDMNAQVLGLFIIGKITQAALSRSDSPDLKKLPVFYTYIDEFQNFTTPSIATILSEARKYGISLNVAHQYIKQLDEKIRDAIFGNVGTKCIFRVGTEDAEFLEKSLKPEFSAKDIQGQENYNAYLSLLVNGVPTKPFDINTLPPLEGDLTVVETIKQLSYAKYGRDRATVEAEIQSRYQPAAPDPNEAFDPFARF